MPCIPFSATERPRLRNEMDTDNRFHCRPPLPLGVHRIMIVLSHLLGVSGVELAPKKMIVLIFRLLLNAVGQEQA